jgi:hypothetical protein
MDPITLGLIGAGIGALKSNEERNRWQDQQMAEAEKTRYGAFTGMKGENLAPPTGDMGHMFAGAAAGYALGQKGDVTDKDSDQVESSSESQSFQEPADDTRGFENYWKKQKDYEKGMSRPDDSYTGTLYAH